jgi:GNAT superfamily N-acetyltransferase
MIREVRADELGSLSALCQQAKAHWGYDAALLAAFEHELTVRPESLGPGLVCWDPEVPLGLAQVSVSGPSAELEFLFVDPSAMGQGVGRHLFTWAVDHARSKGARRLGIDSDPFAEPFYLHMGATRVGTAPSGSIPGRLLPRLDLDLG